jgi:hypothetical protein
MKRSVLLTLLLGSHLFLSSCYTLTAHVENTDKPILVNRSVLYANAEKSNFVSEGAQYFFFWGLVGNDNQVIQEKLLQQLGTHQALQNVKVSSEFSFGDMLISAITLGIVAPRSFRVTGEVIKNEN